MNTVMGKKMVQQVYNKIESHHEVSIPEAISHLLEFPDHYMDASFVNISTTQLLHHFKYLNQLFLSQSPSQADIDMDKDEEQLDGEIVNIDVMDAWCASGHMACAWRGGHEFSPGCNQVQP